MKERKKILFIIGSLASGGAEKHLSQISYGLIEKGWGVEICLLSPYIEIERHLLHSKLKIFHLPLIFHENYLYKTFFLFKIFVAIGYALMLLKVLLTRKYYFVHMFLPHAYLLGGFLSLFSRVPVKIMSRRSLNRYRKNSKLILWCEKFLHKRMSYVLGNSKAVLKELRLEGVEDQKLKLIYNGIDHQLFSQASLLREETRKSLNLSSKDFIIIIVANLIPYKGHTDLIEALSRINNDLSNWKLLIIGNDRERKKEKIKNLKELILKLRLNKKITIIEKVIDVTKFLAVADLGILCSHEEGFSNAILEYMAAGLPVVATKVGGNSEAIIDGVNGYIVEPRNPKMLGDKILQIYMNEDIKKMGDRNYKRVKELFSLKKCVQEYEKVYIESF